MRRGTSCGPKRPLTKGEGSASGHRVCAAVRIPGIRFVRSNNRVYQLVAARPNGRALVYDSARPDPEFEDVENGWDPGHRPWVPES